MAEARATTRTQWAIAVGGGLLLSAALVLWLRPAPSSAPSVTLAAAPSVATQPQAPQPYATPLPAAQAPPPALILRGILAHGSGGSAILEDAKGGQRLVAVGRPVAAGWRLVRLSPSAATFEADAGNLHILQFENGQSNAAPTAPAAPTTAPTTALKATPESLIASSTAYRLALRPIRGETDVTGWTVQSPETIPLFRLAGLQPGDTLLSVNGQPLISQEKIIDLPSEIAGANNLSVEYSRAGQKTTVQIDLIR